MIGASLTGRYLFAFDQRYPPDSVIAGVGYFNAASIPPVKPGITTTRSAPLGPIVGPPAPQVALLHRAIVQGDRVLVAHVRCSVACHIHIEALDRNSGSVGETTMTGSRLVGVARRRMIDGPLQVHLFVGDGPQIQGTSRLGQSG